MRILKGKNEKQKIQQFQNIIKILETEETSIPQTHI